jgi:tRNA dimethylallyltransferase
MQPTLIVILGPTGVGKTEISLQLAQYLQSPIISADSRQIYKELKIGTAAPSAEQLSTVKHYFIGSHSILENFSAGQFEQEVLSLLEEHFISNNIGLMVGGSMLYIDAGMQKDWTIFRRWMRQQEITGKKFLKIKGLNLFSKN